MKVAISKIKGNENNPRTLKTDKFKKLVNSIKEFPKMLEIRPIIVDEDMMVLGGNMRLKACQKVGLKEVHINKFTKKMADEMNVKAKEDLRNEKTYEEYCEEFIIKDNVGFGEWDWDVIANQWDEKLLNEWGLDIPKDVFENEINAEADNYELPSEIETDIVLGDLIEIGEHRLLCGDSTDSDQVAKLMNGKKADIAFTSPPYNAGKNVRGNFYENDTDNKTNEEYINFLVDFSNNTILNSKYSFVNIQLLESNKTDLIEYQYKLKNNIKDILIWNKNIAPPHINKGTFATKWEYVIALSENNKSRGFPCKWQGKFVNVIETENASGNNYADIHKATFPISFPSWIIEKMDFAKSVLDVFCGTGTTMVASHQLKRKCYGMELDPKYCQLIVDRMIKLDENLIVKINGKEYKDKDILTSA